MVGPGSRERPPENPCCIPSDREADQRQTKVACKQETAARVYRLSGNKPPFFRLQQRGFIGNKAKTASNGSHGVANRRGLVYTPVQRDAKRSCQPAAVAAR